MTKRPRRNHSADFKAKVALAAIAKLFRQTEPPLSTVEFVPLPAFRNALSVVPCPCRFSMTCFNQPSSASLVGL
jgi:hypothetical protein